MADFRAATNQLGEEGREGALKKSSYYHAKAERYSEREQEAYTAEIARQLKTVTERERDS